MRPTDFRHLQTTTIENFRLDISRISDRVDKEKAQALLIETSSRIYKVDRLNDPRNAVYEIVSDFRQKLKAITSPIRKAYGVSQPPHMKVVLFGHQLVAVREMELFERSFTRQVGNVCVSSRVGVLGDKVGSGKTYELLAVVIRDRMKFPNDFFTDLQFSHINTVGNISIQPGVIYRAIPATLVTCSRSIIKQWESSLNQTDLKWVTVSTEGMFDRIDPTAFDVVVISTDLINDYTEYWNEHAWKRLIYDEPDSARISAMKRVVAGFTWLVSATSEMIQHESENLRHVHYLRALFTSALGPADVQTFLNYIMIRTPEEFIHTSMNLPPYVSRRIFVEPPRDVSILQGILDPEIMRRINAGDISGAVKALGGEEKDNIVDSALSKLNSQLEHAKDQKKIHVDSEKSAHREEKIKEWDNKIAKIETQISTLEARIKEGLASDCAICASTIKDPVHIPCSHIFCGRCILEWCKKKTECPVCRKVFGLNQINVVVAEVKKEGNGKEEKEKVYQTKLEAVMELINQGGKVIVFSEFVPSFDQIRNELLRRKIPFSHLDGNRQEREADIRKYKTGDLNVLLLASRINGSGLNLQNTNKIILLHLTEPLLKSQLVGRAHRIGYKGGLEVVEVLFTNETINNHQNEEQ